MQFFASRHEKLLKGHVDIGLLAHMTRGPLTVNGRFMRGFEFGCFRFTGKMEQITNTWIYRDELKITHCSETNYIAMDIDRRKFKNDAKLTLQFR